MLLFSVESEKKEAESKSIENLDKKRAEASEEPRCSASSSDKNIESKSIQKAEKKGAAGLQEQGCSVSASSSSAFPCIDRLREELSCAVRVNPLLNLDASFHSSIEGCFFYCIFYFILEIISLNFCRFVWRYVLNLVPLLVVTGRI